MNCPRCLDALIPKFAGDVEIDVCVGCGGWWLDRGELGKLVARGHRMGPTEPQRPGEDPPGLPDPITGETAATPSGGNVGFRDVARPTWAETTMRCPRDNAVLQEAGVGGELVVTIDKCPQCGGFWLDAGELDRTVDLVRERLGGRVPPDVEVRLDRRALFERELQSERGRLEDRPSIGGGRRRRRGGGFFDADDLLEGVGRFALIAVVFNLIGELFD